MKLGDIRIYVFLKKELYTIISTTKLNRIEFNSVLWNQHYPYREYEHTKQRSYDETQSKRQRRDRLLRKSQQFLLFPMSSGQYIGMVIWF